MHGTDDAAAGEECPENREPERGEDEPHIPDLQHAAFFLHHDGVEEGGADDEGISEAFSTGSHPQ